MLKPTVQTVGFFCVQISVQILHKKFKPYKLAQNTMNEIYCESMKSTTLSGVFAGVHLSYVQLICTDNVCIFHLRRNKCVQCARLGLLCRFKSWKSTAFCGVFTGVYLYKVQFMHPFMG